MNVALMRWVTVAGTSPRVAYTSSSSTMSVRPPGISFVGVRPLPPTSRLRLATCAALEEERTGPDGPPARVSMPVTVAYSGEAFSTCSS